MTGSLRRAIPLGLMAAATLALPDAAGAKTYEVNTAADHKPRKCTKRDCTLREAVIKANEHDGIDKVKVPAAKGPYELKRGGTGEDEAKTGDLDVTDATDVVGQGGRAVVEQKAADRVFHTHPGVTFDSSFARMTVAGGSDVPAGGGILVEHPTFLSESVIRDNRAGVGGGVAAVGPDSRFAITNGTVSGNRAIEEGGGIYAAGNDGVSFNVSLSTITGNRAPVGGGVSTVLGDADIVFSNSTVALNEATSDATASGGGVYVNPSGEAGVVTIGHTTIASNEAPVGASNLQALDTVEMENTIVADPAGGAPNCTLDVDSVGHNLEDGTTCGLDQGTDVEPGQADLKQLDDNGGPTETMALKASSDAIDGGTCPGTLVVFGVDQRGEGRPSVCDIGSFERDPLP